EAAPPTPVREPVHAGLIRVPLSAPVSAGPFAADIEDRPGRPDAGDWDASAWYDEHNWPRPDDSSQADGSQADGIQAAATWTDDGPWFADDTWGDEAAPLRRRPPGLPSAAGATTDPWPGDTRLLDLPPARAPHPPATPPHARRRVR